MTKKFNRKRTTKKLTHNLCFHRRLSHVCYREFGRWHRTSQVVPGCLIIKWLHRSAERTNGSWLLLWIRVHGANINILLHCGNTKQLYCLFHRYEKLYLFFSNLVFNCKINVSCSPTLICQIRCAPAGFWLNVICCSLSFDLFSLFRR